MPMAEALAPLQPFFAAVSFVLGTVVGSFCNVCASRWPAGESVVSPRSRCPKCKSAIAWYDNIPILSWLILGAKCRKCSLPISWQYPLVEALTGVLFLLVFLRFGFTAAAPIYMLLAAALVVVTFQDLADWTIPNEITFPGIPLGLVLSLLGMVWPGSGLRVVSPFDAMAGAALGGGILYTLDRVTVLLLKKPGMGFGDVKLLTMLGAFLGWQGALGTIILGSIAGSIVGVSIMGYYRWKGTHAPAPPADEHETESVRRETNEDGEETITLEGHYLPFGPYLALGGFVFLLFGPELVDWYVALLTLPPIVPGALPVAP